MGLLKSSDCLEWKDILALKEKLKRNGVKQFVRVYTNAHSTFMHEFIWGDEIEFMVCARQYDLEVYKENDHDSVMCCGDDIGNDIANDNNVGGCNRDQGCSDAKDKKVDHPDNNCSTGSENDIVLTTELHKTTTLEGKNNRDIRETYLLTKQNLNKYQCINDDESDNMHCTDPYKNRLVLCSEKIMSKFKDPSMLTTVEFAGYMIETTPSKPHPSTFDSLLKIEECMVFRLKRIKNEIQSIAPNGFPLLMTLFPKIGKYNAFLTSDCNDDEVKHRGTELSYDKSTSIYFPDNAITMHKRFYSFVENIIKRRGRKVEGYIKIMENKKRMQERLSDTKNDNHKNNIIDNKNEKGDIVNKDLLCTQKDMLKDHIMIDAMGQGMGCCCLQLILQAPTMKEARMLYDTIGAICPLLLRLTRATPIAQGKLLSTETRWDMLVFSVDDRTDEERGCRFTISGDEINKTNINANKSSANINNANDINSMSKNTANLNNIDTGLDNINDLVSNDTSIQLDMSDIIKNAQNVMNFSLKKVNKSRFSSIDMYISDSLQNLEYYNDLNPPLHKDSYDLLKLNGVDELMARHIASLFVRDPILVYKPEDESEINPDNENETSNTSSKENSKINSETSSGSSTNNKENICNEDINIEGHDHSHTKSVLNNTIVKDVPHINTDDFENIQSSNWRSMRFKLPNQNCCMSEKGWKVEVRPMEIQPTPFENIAWCVFVVLLSRSIVHYRANFYIPLSMVDENFRRANLLYNTEDDYVVGNNSGNTGEKKEIAEDRAFFYYRKNIFDSGTPDISEGSIREIFMGFEGYEGLFNMVLRFTNEFSSVLDFKGSGRSLNDYLDFVKGRLTNKYMSVSDWMRRFVINNGYEFDGCVSEDVIDRLVDQVAKITEENSVEYLRNLKIE